MTEKPNYDAMTVNERLWTAGQVENFDNAILLRDRSRASAILIQLDVVDPNETVDAILAHPGKYGFY